MNVVYIVWVYRKFEGINGPKVETGFISQGGFVEQNICRAIKFTSKANIEGWCETLRMLPEFEIVEILTWEV